MKTGGFVPDRVRQVDPESQRQGALARDSDDGGSGGAGVAEMVLEPIFEADSTILVWFAARRRAQDAIAEIHYLGSATRDYGWVFEADITACFDEINHQALLGRVRARISDKKVLGLVKAFLKAGVLTEDGLNRDTRTGTPQGGILFRCWPHRLIRSR